MPPPEWTDEQGIGFPQTSVNARTVKGDRIAGAAVTEIKNTNSTITLHEWERGLYQFGYRVLHFLKKIKLFVTEKRQGLRFQAVFSGELNIEESNGQKSKLPAGHYHFTEAQRHSLLFKKEQQCRYFVSYFPDELLREFGIAKEMVSRYANPILTELMDF